VAVGEAAVVEAALDASRACEDWPGKLYGLWLATGDRLHLAEAKRLLDEHLARNPPEYRDSMCRNVRVNREILAAWRQEFGTESKDDGRHGTESMTRSG